MTLRDLLHDGEPGRCDPPSGSSGSPGPWSATAIQAHSPTSPAPILIRDPEPETPMALSRRLVRAGRGHRDTFDQSGRHVLSRTIPFSASGFPYSEDLAPTISGIDCDSRLAGLETGGGQKPSIISDIFSTLRRTMPPTSPVRHGGPLVIGDTPRHWTGSRREGAEIVAGVGEEPPLAGECPVQPLEHPVKGGGESGDLVIGALRERCGGSDRKPGSHVPHR